MLLKTITLTNYGLYRGQQTIDVAPRRRHGRSRPVVVFGGKNGAGKTTLQEAVRVCLYGPAAIGARVARREYEAFLDERIHRADTSLIKAPAAGVCIEFDYVQEGVCERYVVERCWARHGKSIREQLQVRRNGEPLTACDQDHWDEFLKSLIPPGVSQFFFFDGEKIQELADAKGDDGGLADAVKNLLGLDLVDQLEADLRIFLARATTGGRAESLRGEWDDVQDKLALTQRKLTRVREDRAALQTRLDQVTARLESLEERLAREGAGFARDRDDLKVAACSLDAQVEQALTELRGMAAGLLPFSLCRGLVRSLLTQLAAEEETQRKETFHAMLLGRLGPVKRSLSKSQLFRGLTKLQQCQKDTIHERVSSALTRLTERPSAKDASLVAEVHGVSAEQRARISEWGTESLEHVPMETARLSRRLERLERDRRKTEARLAHVRDDSVMLPLLNKISTANRELGAAEAKLTEQTHVVSQLENELRQLQSRAQKLDEQLTKVKRQSQAVENARRVRAVLQRYGRELVLAKVARLRGSIEECFSRLCRKSDLIERIEIDPTDFQLTLFGRNDHPLPKHQLSAGEKQIFAIAVLWGLAQASGRPLPLIIDTPLGRLDSDHRSTFLSDYFPHASHQVLILSTDTELDRDHFEALSPHVSHAYHLDYDAASGATTVRNGYFWQTVQRASDAG